MIAVVFDKGYRRFFKLKRSGKKKLFSEEANKTAPVSVIVNKGVKA